VDGRLREVAKLRKRLKEGHDTVRLRIEIAEKELMAMVTLVEGYTLDHKSATYPGVARVLGEFATRSLGTAIPLLYEQEGVLPRQLRARRQAGA
jgi:hypothetical protein